MTGASRSATRRSTKRCTAQRVARQQAYPDREAGPDQWFHSLRHTYASLCLAAGIRPIDIAELMGHRDVKTTLTVYAHLINADDHTGQHGRARGAGGPSAEPLLRQRNFATRLRRVYQGKALLMASKTFSNLVSVSSDSEARLLSRLRRK
ncbi:tyrosine-type recombinase/integrase [Mycobacterium intracellulare]|uniref:tyrosine-type recombinase/integrase n=1 Tax=Mycobacterium intracellulare TaxID=1767 RepID=UPI001CDB2CF9|nr:tyrosine-type recombinase/integrase [Mycobacterium intracellulare]